VHGLKRDRRRNRQLRRPVLSGMRRKPVVIRACFRHSGFAVY
jgi:hypothetical protein